MKDIDHAFVLSVLRASLDDGERRRLLERTTWSSTAEPMAWGPPDEETLHDVRIYNPYWEKNIVVDARVAALTQAIWDLSLTLASCTISADATEVQLSFPTGLPAEEFLSVIAQDEPGLPSLFNALEGAGRNGWRYDVRVFDQNSGRNCLRELALETIVVFPAEQYDDVLRLVKRALTREKRYIEHRRCDK